MSTTRAVEMSLFPEHAPDKPVGPILPSVFVGTNADLIHAVAPYYLTGSVMDCTYGEGKWWQRFTPAQFVAHDLKTDGVDFTALPEADDIGPSEYVVVPDPELAAGHEEQIGLTCHDLIVHHAGSGPGGHTTFTPKRARRHHSYLLVFTKGLA